MSLCFYDIKLSIEINKYYIFAIIFKMKFLKRSFFNYTEGNMYFIEYSWNHSVYNHTIIFDELNVCTIVTGVAVMAVEFMISNAHVRSH